MCAITYQMRSAPVLEVEAVVVVVEEAAVVAVVTGLPVVCVALLVGL